MLMTYLLYIFLSLAYILIIGIGLSTFLKKDLFYFPVFLLSFISAISLILTVLKIQISVIYLLPIIFLLPYFFQGIKKINKEFRNLLVFFIFAFLLFSIFQIFIEYYPLGLDWYGWYLSSIYISNNDLISSLNSSGGRNILFSLVEGSFLTIFTKQFFVAQIVAPLISLMIIFPFYLLAKKILLSKIISFSLIILVFNPFVLENTLYNWPKLMVAMFILYFIIFSIEKKVFETYITGVLAFLSHSFAILYIVPFYVMLTFRQRIWIKSLVLFILTLFFILSSSLLMKQRNNLIFYPFAVNGYEKLEGLSVNEIFEQFFSKPIYYHFFVRLITAANTFFPTIPFLKMIDIFFDIPLIGLHKIVDITKLPLIYYYFQSIPGGLTMGVYIFFIMSLFFKENKKFILTYILLPSIFIISFFGYAKPGSRDVLAPLIPLIIVLSVKSMERFDNKIILAVLFVMIIELIIFSLLYFDFIGYFKQVAIERNINIYQIMTINKLVFN